MAPKFYEASSESIQAHQGIKAIKALRPRSLDAAHQKQHREQYGSKRKEVQACARCRKIKLFPQWTERCTYRDSLGEVKVWLADTPDPNADHGT